MDRRRVLAAVAGVSLLSALPQARGQSRIKRVAKLSGYLESPASAEDRAEFAKGFEPFGYRVGDNLDIRWYEVPLRDAHGIFAAQLAKMAAERPDCVVTHADSVEKVKDALPSTPIVARVEGDPVQQGLAATLQRPGGIVTGLHDGQREVSSKRIEILKAFIPGLRCVAWISFSGQLGMYPPFEAAAREAGLQVRQIVIDRSEVPRLESFRRELAGLRAAGCPAGHFHSAIPEAIDAFTAVALEHKLAFSYSGNFDRWETEGFLFLYGARTRARGQSVLGREAAIAARILRGERPGDIPFEGPTGYYLLVNGKTAARIGLSIPPAVSIMAEQVSTSDNPQRLRQ